MPFQTRSGKGATSGREIDLNWFWLKACTKCGGDLAVDDGDWICLQCGTYYYTGLYQETWASIPLHPVLKPANTEDPGDVRRAQIGHTFKTYGFEVGSLLGVN